VIAETADLGAEALDSLDLDRGLGLGGREALNVREFHGGDPRPHCRSDGGKWLTEIGE
jgi:hypothetical protein